MMRTSSIRCCAGLACVWLFVGAPRAAELPQAWSARRSAVGSAGWAVAGGFTAGRQLPPADHAAARRTFAERVNRYAALRARLEEPLPPFDLGRDPWSLMLTRRYLASAIRAARPDARQGDIFTPQVALMFRRLVRQAIHELDLEALATDLAEPLVDLVVNEPIPAWALEEAPDALLERLPALPQAIEYRLVGGSLILWDAHAEILIDELPDAFMGDATQTV